MSEFTLDPHLPGSFVKDDVHLGGHRILPFKHSPLYIESSKCIGFSYFDVELTISPIF